MLSKQRGSQRTKTSRAKSIYFMTWRWHFYAGLFVIPFMLMLSLTGLIMLFDDEIEFARYQSILKVEQGEHTAPISSQIEAINKVYPNSQVSQFIPSPNLERANRFSIQTSDGHALIALVNPYTAEVQGTIDRSDSIYELMNRIHGTLLIGDLGDRLIEIAASLGILLLVTGLYLWFPNDAASWSGFLKVRLTSGSRILLRDLHANIGGVLSLVLLFFLISGLSWAGVWGSKLVQAWNTFPTYYTWGDKPESSLQLAHSHNDSMTHSDMNHGDTKELPWNLEQAPVPESDVSHHGHATSGSSGDYSLSEHTVLIDEIVEKAQSLGFSHYRLFLPSSNTGVYTIAANSMAGDITDAREDRTTHIDQYTGEVLMDVTWSDYSVFAKFMAVGVSLHQGDLSLLNKVLNILFCIAFVFVSVSGALMWWWRRPRSSGSISAPPRFQQDGVWKTGLVTLILVCLMFPLGGLAVVSILILDWLLFSRVQRLKAILS